MPSGLPREKQLALMPGWERHGTVVARLPGVPSTDACAEQCRAALPECSFFSFCQAQGGCNGEFLGQMVQGDCLLLNRNCTLPAGRSPAGGMVSGFPVHHFPGPLMEAFPTYLAEAIQGADFPCPNSEVEGKCAFTSIASALSNCIRLGSACMSVSVYVNGTNGCSSEPLAFLKSEVPTNANAFVSPDVYTLIVTEATKSLRGALLFAEETELDMPSDEEIRETGADAPDSLAYKGCHIGANALYRGDIVAVVDNVPSPKACCRECTARNVAAGRRVCTVWNYCSEPGGCFYSSGREDGSDVKLAQGQCELRFQPLPTSVTSLPHSLLASGPSVPFVAGAPNALWAPEVPGYRRVLGETLMVNGAYECDGSLRPETGECVKAGSLQELADSCTASKECTSLSFRLGPQPNGTTSSTQLNGAAASISTIGSFKAHSDTPLRVVFPTAVLYTKDSAAGSSGSSGLSGGAVAGIAVGAVAGAAMLTAAAWLLLQRGQRRRRQHEQRKGCEEEAAAGCCCSCGRSTASGSRSVSAPSSTLGGTTSPTLSGPGTFTTSADALPELVAHVAAHEAALVSHRNASPEASAIFEWEESMLLPPHLHAWVVDAAQVHYLRRSDGKLWDIGSGASGKVYRVEYRGEALAAKEVELGASQSLRETFVTEARMLHQLRHPNVVGFAGVTFHGTKGVVLMELCEGRDLHSALQVRAAGSQERLFAWHRRGKRVALDVAKAMNFLHQNNVVHMDIKSPNILLTAAGTAKLADVGFSKSKPNTYLSTVSLVGTFAWAAPELLLGSERPTSAVDVYSFGVVLFEIITGERPQRGQLRMPRDDECPAEVRKLMLDCLQQQPSARPTSLQVLQRLRALVEGGHTPPSPGTINTAPPAAAKALGAAHPEPSAHAPDTPDGVAAEGSAAAAVAPAAACAAVAPPAAPVTAIEGVAPVRRPIMSIQLRPTPPSPFAS